MQSLTTDLLLKFLAGELDEDKIAEIEQAIANNPFYADIIKGLSMMMDEFGSIEKVKSFLAAKQKLMPLSN